MLDRIAEVEEVIGQRNVVPGELAIVMNISVPEAAQLLSLRKNKNQFQQRHSGSGEYAGIIVVLLAAWALFFALQKRANIYSPPERQMILFWAALARRVATFGLRTARVVLSTRPSIAIF